MREYAQIRWHTRKVLMMVCSKLPELADHVKDVHPLAANELSGVRNWELTEMRGRLGLGVARK